MKRETKFRGQRVDKNELVYGDLITGVGQKRGKMYILPHVVNLANLSGCHPLDGYEVIPETVGEFTGLTDKNGKEIYEGDFITNEAIKELWNTWLVEFDRGCFGYSGIALRVMKNIEVIGNIQENPELLQ